MTQCNILVWKSIFSGSLLHTFTPYPPAQHPLISLCMVTWFFEFSPTFLTFPLVQQALGFDWSNGHANFFHNGLLSRDIDRFFSFLGSSSRFKCKKIQLLLILLRREHNSFYIRTSIAMTKKTINERTCRKCGRSILVVSFIPFSEYL